MSEAKHNKEWTIDLREIEEMIKSDDSPKESHVISEEEEAAVIQIQEMICVDPEDLRMPFQFI